MYKKFREKYNSIPSQYFFKEREIQNSFISDLFNTLFLIYYYDISEKRIPKTANIVNIEVDNLSTFQNLKVRIEKLTNFMSDEKWNINFIKKEKQEIITNKKLFSTPENKFEVISLLSGGLDSFTGIFYNKNKKTKFVGYRINDLESKSQKQLKEFIKIQDNGSEFILYELKNPEKKEIYTQRTRSLFFFGLGIVEAYFSDLNKVNIYENGIMSLNIPVNHTRITTKTTHPKTLFLLNSILEALNIDIKIENTCINKTKAEMVADLTPEYIEQIKDTMTCGVSRTNPKYQNDKYNHCGACIPCLLRKITIVANDLEEKENQKKPYQIPYNQSIYSSNENLRKNFLFKEYKSGIIYFIELKNAILNGEIENYLSNAPRKYYPDEKSYKERKKMLLKFAIEVEYFFQRYPEILKKEE